MARIYYDTPQRVFKLFKEHPALSQMYSEFSIDTDGIKRVAEFLILNHDKINSCDLKSIYNSKTPNTYEPDQDDPIAGSVDTANDLLSLTPNIGDIYEVAAGGFYKYDTDGWVIIQESIDVSNSNYLSSLYQEKGYKVWENESGLFMAMEDDNDKIVWEEVNNIDSNYTIIRKSQLPINPIPGEVYRVKGEDLVDIIASLYGLIERGMNPPYTNWISERKTNLQELLNMTVYLYRYGVTDNFYEKNIWQFLPEYDRNQMLEQPKIKLFMESIGRKLDQLEDKLNRLEDVYDIDETPTELLDHLGQMLGYEKEDFSLSDVSFRELLKNIVEIYKIKGTNYSFSFFFKFLGFNVNLKEFYFNKNVTNPEAFPGMDENNVEFYLTTTNPLLETNYGYPAKFLGQIRALDDWEMEKDALLNGGCNNIIEYMLGNESYNNNGETYHKNPWAHFKTNLIEYELNPFFEKVNLTSSDNETIKKYIKFLSPTYLFTWINVNLAPWIENINIFDNIEESLLMEINKSIGDVKEGKFNDYENVEDYFQVWDEKENKLIPYTQSDEMKISIVNNLNLGGDDTIGTYLRRDGVYIRQPGHPSNISNVYHDGNARLGFDNLEIMIKPFIDVDYDYKYELLSQLPTSEIEDTLVYVEETDLYYLYKDPAPYWELTDTIPVDSKFIYSSYSLLTQNTNAIIGETYKVRDTNRCYIYHNDEPLWVQADEIEDRYKKWFNYSYRPFPSYPINVKPSPGIKLNVNEVDFVWDNIYEQQGYWIQVSKDIGFTALVYEEFIYDSKNYIENVLLENDNYYWRIRTKNRLSVDTLTVEEMSSINNTEILSYYTYNGSVFVLNTLSGQSLDKLTQLLAGSGNKFNWGPWSSIYRFEVSSNPFPYNNQVINNVDYQFIEVIEDPLLSGYGLVIKWASVLNADSYQINIARDENFLDMFTALESDVNSILVELPKEKLYWRYRSKKKNKDWCEWSDTLSFEVDV